MKKQLSGLLGLAALAVMSGCVTASPDNLFAVNGPAGQVRKSGRFPVIGQIPVGETKQLTENEKLVARRELREEAAAGKAQAAQDSLRDYNNEVAAMRKLAIERKKNLLEDIEENNRHEQPVQ